MNEQKKKQQLKAKRFKIRLQKAKIILYMNSKKKPCL